LLFYKEIIKFIVLQSCDKIISSIQNRHTNRTASVLVWYDRHRAYSTTSGSNREEEAKILPNENRRQNDISIIKGLLA